MKKMLIKLCLFLFFLVILSNIVTLIFVGKGTTRNKVCLQRYKDFYMQQNNSIDILFFGSSHCTVSFNPQVIYEEFGLSAFNLGSSGQSPQISYWVLKEALKTQFPKVVVCELYWYLWDKDDGFFTIVKNWQNIRSRGIKFNMFIDVFSLYEKIEYFLLSLRYRNYIINKLVLNRKKSKKIANELADYSYSNKGYLENSYCMPKEEVERQSKLIYEKYIFDPVTIKKEYLMSLKKMIKLCNNKGIEFVLVSAPINIYALPKVREYSKINKFFSDFANLHGVEYIDYNILNNGFKIFNGTDFKDHNHLNSNGAKKISVEICNRIKHKF